MLSIFVELCAPLGLDYLIWSLQQAEVLFSLFSSEGNGAQRHRHLAQGSISESGSQDSCTDPPDDKANVPPPELFIVSKGVGDLPGLLCGRSQICTIF